ncbi:hypothetical protein RvY_17209 [Ramazzottius varieornatus]|uniref:Uncharacterized protein n=1 Tax=Ramazzottius varieornatus TaxID=947166 RepID=A0A1D1W1C2_RAMVA|nr:hypothetical protein RvY_17209 [Ramazzottius varieornatus]
MAALAVHVFGCGGAYASSPRKGCRASPIHKQRDQGMFGSHSSLKVKRTRTEMKDGRKLAKA